MFPSINWNLLYLELIITTVLVGLIILEIVLPKDARKNLLGTLSFVALIGLNLFWLTQQHLAGTTFGGMFAMDSMAWFFKEIFLITMVFVFAMAQFFFKPTNEHRNEFYFLLWLTLLGMCFIASSADLLLLFIAIEILTISLYVMTAYLKSSKLSIEAGMKYLILGALSSGFYLYGTSFIYGITHSTRFDAISSYAMTHAMTPMALIGVVFIVAAIGFKIASVPFHMWVPDVYQGAPTPVTALLAVGSKAAGFCIMLRLFYDVFIAWHPQWSLLLAVLAALSMCYGNLIAMFQTNIKRLLGYSSIAHAGYLLMGLAAGSLIGAAAVNLYLIGYMFTTLAAFLVIVILSNVSKSENIDDFAGLAKRSGFLAAALLLALVSLAGLPPLAGFFGKFTLLAAVIDGGYLWLALVASVNIIISVYYYMTIAKRMYADAPASTVQIDIPMHMRWLLGLCMAAMLIVGLFPGPFLDAAMNAVKVFIPQA